MEDYPKISGTTLDRLTLAAQASPRLRMNLDLRTSAADRSQRMLNALEPGTKMPVHRHPATTETVVAVRGALREDFYDDNGNVTASHTLRAGDPCPILQVPKGQWHSVDALESGTIIFEAKDGAYAPAAPEDILNMTTA